MIDWKFELTRWEIVGEKPVPPKFSLQNIPIIEGELHNNHRFTPANYELGEDADLSELESSILNNPEFSDNIVQDNSIQQTSEEVKQEQFNLGLAQGKAEASKEFKSDLDNFLAVWRECLEDLTSQFNNQIEIIENSALDLSIDIAEHIIDRKLETDKDLLLGITKELIAEHYSREMVVRIGGTHVDWLMNNIPDAVKEMGLENLNIVVDNSINNGCVLDLGSHQVSFDKAVIFKKN